MKLSIVIPVFNEEESIRKYIVKLKTRSRRKSEYEIIFIDDGSSDNSKKYKKDLINQDSNVRLISFYRIF